MKDKTNETQSSLLHLLADARAEQREAITSSASLIVVSAGAGTGKTHTLARRFAWLLASDPTCRVDQILTLTFTQLAAEEMRERIASTLAEWHKSVPSDHLRDAVERIGEAYISTIHSFALRTIRESGLGLDIDSGASIVSEPYAREFWRDFKWNMDTMSEERLASALSARWRGFAGGLFGKSSFARLANYFGSGLLSNLAEEAGEVFGSMNMSPSDIRDVDRAAERRVQDQIASRLMPEWLDTWDLWLEYLFPEMSGYLDRTDGKFANAMKGLWGRWRNVERGPESARTFVVDLMEGPLSNLTGSSGIKRFLEALGFDLTAWRDSMKRVAEVTSSLFHSPPYGERETRARKMLSSVAALGWECWNAARSNSGLLSFPDLIRFAGEAIRSGPSYALRFRHIMIDEFQDTDGLQDGLIKSLREAWAASDRTGSLRTLFIVGDVKQSIYRFRHAKPDLLAKYTVSARDHEDRSSVHIPLSRSYRMSGRLMERINAVFERVWDHGIMGPEGPALAYEPLTPPTDAQWWTERNGSNAPESPLEIILYSPGLGEADKDGQGGEKREKIPAAERRKKLAVGIARRLVSMTGHFAEGIPEMIWDKVSRAFRRVAWRDIAVLVPTRTSYPAIEEAFGENEIPAIFSRSMGYFNRGEVVDLVNLLWLLNRPEDLYALYGWIESPFSMMPPGSSFRLVSGSKAEGKTPDALFAEIYPEQADRLSKMQRTAELAGPSGALLSLMEDRSWLDAFIPSMRPRVMANVRRCVDVAREYEASMGSSLSACAEYLGEFMRSASPAEEPEALSESYDAVRVMTVHASKGLEFPVVVLLCDGLSSKRRGRSAAVVSRSLGIVPSSVPDIDEDGVKRGDPTPSVTAKWFSFIEDSEKLSEDERLMYVSMTRAQDLLICCGTEKTPSAGSGGAGEDWIDRLTAISGKDGVEFRTIAFSDPMTVCADGRRAPAAPAGGEEAPDRPSSLLKRETGRLEKDLGYASPRLAKFSASAYSLLSWCPVAYRRRYRQGWGMRWETAGDRGAGGADLGSLAHWVLTRWNFDQAELPNYLPSADICVTGAIDEVPVNLRDIFLSPVKRSALLSWLELFSRTETCGRLRELKSRGVLRQELKFSVKLAETDLIGSIDLYWEDSDGCHVRDWKITPEESAPSDLYVEQIRFYSLACRIARPNSRVDAGLIYLRPDDIDSRNYEHAEFIIDNWEKLAGEVSELSRIAATGPFEPKMERCGVCPFSTSCADSTVGINIYPSGN
ncbi:MAG: UvrD-helicase domain-containing protein [Synergistaceae bacterium]|nr:UvrD-helicase domain-containing protein [Synergistaceae bacterium]